MTDIMNGFGGVIPEPADKFRDERGRRTINGRNHKMDGWNYRGFIIVQKKDFGDHGFLIRGFLVKQGYVVTGNGMNVMPGAAWFMTVGEALAAVDDLITANDIERDGDHPFWVLNQLRRASEEHASELTLMLRRLTNLVDKIDGGYLNVVEEGAEQLRIDASELLARIDDQASVAPRTIKVVS